MLLGNGDSPAMSRGVLNRYSSLLLLLFLASPLALRAESKATLRTEADLHTHAEWRVNAQLSFDSSGRLLVLYRDKLKRNPKGNWHLVRLMPPFLDGDAGHEEITFSIPQEPVDPDSRRRWDTFSSLLLLNPAGDRGYAIFEGAVVTANSGPPPPGAVRNVSAQTFASLVSFDLSAFRLLASANLAQPQDGPVDKLIGTGGDLLLLYLTDTNAEIVSFDELLHEVKTVRFSAAPIGKTDRSFCRLRQESEIECPARGKRDILLGAQSDVRLPESTCKMSLGAFGIGKDETVKNYTLESDHLCTRNELGNEEVISADLLPRCPQGWQVSAISPDRHSALTSCILMGTFLDTFSYISRADLQLIHVPTLAVKTTIPLSTRRRSVVAVFHSSGTSTVAVLEDGTKLVVYKVAD